MALVEYHMLKYSPSIIAAGAVYAGIKIFNKRCPLPPVLREYWSSVASEVSKCAKDLIVLFQVASRHPL